MNFCLIKKIYFIYISFRRVCSISVGGGKIFIALSAKTILPHLDIFLSIFVKNWPSLSVFRPLGLYISLGLYLSLKFKAHLA